MRSHLRQRAALALIVGLLAGACDTEALEPRVAPPVDLSRAVTLVDRTPLPSPAVSARAVAQARQRAAFERFLVDLGRYLASLKQRGPWSGPYDVTLEPDWYRWRALGQCETALNWRHRSASGRFEGAFGFYSGTWDTIVAGHGYPSGAHLAAPWQQLNAARAAKDRWGIDGWGCSPYWRNARP